MGGITVDPLNWFRGFVVLANVAHELTFEISEGGNGERNDKPAATFRLQPLQVLDERLNIVEEDSFVPDRHIHFLASAGRPHDASQ